jgi:predicted GIY-YIG superfamily endonuclease
MQEVGGSIPPGSTSLRLLREHSINSREQEYIGATADLKRRLPEHNAGKATRQIQAVGIGLVLCFPRQVQSARM